MRTTTTTLLLVLGMMLSCGGASKSVMPAALAEAPAAMCSATPTPAPPVDQGCAEAPAPAGLASKFFHQLRYHQSFPATRAQVLSSLQASAELDAAESAWIAQQLPALRFKTARDLMLALFPDAPAAAVAALQPHPTLALR
jgi:hypothetical protein